MKEKSLTLLGVSEQGYIAFNYSNQAESFAQSFGINLKKYLGAQFHNITDAKQANKDKRDWLKFTEYE
jgi:hypothetical protein